jgi:hypothetical protein
VRPLSADSEHDHAGDRFRSASIHASGPLGLIQLQRGFRYMDETPHATIRAAHKVADLLQQHGHDGQASALRAALVNIRPRSMLLAALRETCQVVLTAIEAIDPVCAALVEELRLEVDKRLTEGHSSAKGD